MYTVSRPINGISINGDEYLHTKEGVLMLFETIGELMTFLEAHDIELETVNVHDESKKETK